MRRPESARAPGRAALLIAAAFALLAAAWLTYRAAIAATGHCDCAGDAWQALLWAPAATAAYIAAAVLAVRALRTPP
jgi:hypothetical protein